MDRSVVLLHLRQCTGSAARRQAGYIGVGFAVVVSVILISGMKYLLSHSQQSMKIQEAQINLAADTHLLSRVLSALHDRRVIILSAESKQSKTNQTILQNCLRSPATCPTSPTPMLVLDTRLASQQKTFSMSSLNEKDFLYNDRGFFCSGRGPNKSGSGDCTYAVVVEFSASSNTIRFDATVFPKERDQRSSIRLGGDARTVSSKKSWFGQPPSALQNLAPEYNLDSFWSEANPIKARTTKCYPGSGRTPAGLTEYLSPKCGTFNLPSPTLTNCPLGTAVKSVSPSGVTTCGKP